MNGTSSTTDTLAPGFRGVALLDLAHHVADHKLPAPLTVDLIQSERVLLWVDTFGCERWVDSIHVDADGSTPTENPRYVWRQVDGRLPVLGIKVRLRFLQAIAPAPELRVVEGGDQ